MVSPAPPAERVNGWNSRKTRADARECSVGYRRLAALGSVPCYGALGVLLGVGPWYIERAFDCVKSTQRPGTALVTHRLNPWSPGARSDPTYPSGPPAMRTARSSARALFSVSSYSSAGRESATTPAPACTYARPSRATTVRMAMAVSIDRPP